MPRTILPEPVKKSRRTLFPEKQEQGYLLPDILVSGTWLRIGGLRAKVVGTSQRDSMDQKYMRLYYPGHIHNGWVMPSITGNTLWTRDDLQEQGARIIEKKGRRTT